MRWRQLLATGLGLIAPSLLSAQVCVGNPSLATVSANLSASAGFFDGGKEWGAGVTAGSELFFSGSFSYADFDDTTLSLKGLGASVGYGFPSESEVAVCLGATGSYGFGLEIFGVDITTLRVGPAVSVGVEAEDSPTVSFLPFGQFAWFYERVTADGGTSGTVTETGDSGALAFGGTLLFNDTLGIGPLVVVPLGVEGGGDTVFGVYITVGVGRRVAP
jgi:hypothetical protein